MFQSISIFSSRCEKIKREKSHLDWVQPLELPEIRKHNPPKNANFFSYDQKFHQLITLLPGLIRFQVVSRQKLNSNRENIVLYSINLNVFSIAIEFLTTNELDSEWSNTAGLLSLLREPPNAADHGASPKP